jgi:mitochondrial import inner membrane translocase subunit TIM44
MLVARRAPGNGVRRHVINTFASSSQYGRTAVYRRLNTYSTLQKHQTPHPYLSTTLRSDQQQLLAPQLSLLSRSLQTSARLSQKPQPKEEVRDPPRSEEAEQKASEAGSAESEGAKEKTEESKEGEEDKEKKDDKDSAPPPPHGDKTPWQVFRETLTTEFKASQEWNESTKQLSGRVQTFTESEGVRKAREASEAASAGASKVLKGTGKALGQGASWTWNTSAVQGVRAGVNATGRGIEKATRPIRDTQAFKDISDALDDGSSSRYGGWVEKEERHKRREARELKESGKRIEKIEEDPK